jgi:hypothetical protein
LDTILAGITGIDALSRWISRAPQSAVNLLSEDGRDDRRISVVTCSGNCVLTPFSGIC